MNIELLNAIKNFIIQNANENGICLKSEFGSPANFKNFVISLAITMIMEKFSVPINVAYDVVWGNGSFQQLADDVWTTLNSHEV